jgi:hypothetical protein
MPNAPGTRYRFAVGNEPLVTTSDTARKQSERLALSIMPPKIPNRPHSYNSRRFHQLKRQVPLARTLASRNKRFVHLPHASNRTAPPKANRQHHRATCSRIKLILGKVPNLPKFNLRSKRYRSWFFNAGEFFHHCRVPRCPRSINYCFSRRTITGRTSLFLSAISSSASPSFQCFATRQDLPY